jgi:DNA-binding transcriptional LysR family regulator
MRFTLAQLEAFHWIARLGSFQGAAHQLNVAQPTISLRIRELEQNLGVTLFERVGRSVRLSSDGEVLLELSGNVLSEARRIQERVGSATNVQGLIRLGVPETFALACLPELMRFLAVEHPGLRVELAIGTSTQLSEDLEERRIDVAVLGDPKENLRLRTIPLGHHTMKWVAHESFDLREPVRPIDLRGLPIISTPPPAPQFGAIMDWFREAGLTPLHVSSCSSVAVIAELVSSGVGVSLLPVSIVKRAARAGRVRLLNATPPVPSSHLFVSYRISDGGVNIDAVVRSITDVLARVPFLEESRR